MATVYPVVVFHFQVEWGGTRLGFTEVSGLNAGDYTAIEYREGNALNYSVTKMPGIQKFGDITLKRGVMANDNEFFTWITSIKLNTVERRDLTISLLNENHEPVVVWKVSQAWPTKVEGISLKSTGNEVGVESITLAIEGMVIQNGG